MELNDAFRTLEYL